MSAATQEQVARAIDSVPGWSRDSVRARPLVGGLLNSNWVAEHDGKTYFMKVYGIGSENFINRDLSIEAARAAHAMGIAPEVLHYDSTTGVEVCQFLTGYRASTNADFSRRDFQERVIDLYAAFNAAPKLSVTKDVFEMTDEHIEQGAAVGAIRPADFAWLHQQYGRAKQAFHAAGLDIVPCHNDPMPGNFLVPEGQGQVTDMKLVDYEFASNNERAYEIGVFLGEMFIDPASSQELIERYYGVMRRDLLGRVTVARAVADMKWGSWAVQQRQLSSWDFDYQKYGIWKYARARSLFNHPDWNDWLTWI